MRLVEEVESVQALHPADFDLHIQVVRIVFVAGPNHRLAELCGPGSIRFWYDRLVLSVAVDAGNLIGRKLKHLELDIGAFQSEGQGGNQETRWGHDPAPRRHAIGTPPDLPEASAGRPGRHGYSVNVRDFGPAADGV